MSKRSDRARLAKKKTFQDKENENFEVNSDFLNKNENFFLIENVKFQSKSGELRSVTLMKNL